MPQVGIAIERFEVFFGIAGHRQAETVGVPAADVGDQFVSVAVAVGRRHERRFAARRIAAQRDDVLDAGSLDVVEKAIEVGAAGTDAGEMTGRLHAVLALDEGRDLQRPLARGAERAVGDGHVARCKLDQLRQDAAQRLHRRVALGREDLEGNMRAGRSGVKFGKSHSLSLKKCHHESHESHE